MLPEADLVQLNLILDNPTSSYICINILSDEEFRVMANKLGQQIETPQAIKAQLEQGFIQKADKEKLDLLIYQYKDMILVRLNGKWVKFD